MKFSSTAEKMLENQHYDSSHIRYEINQLQNKWSTFHRQVGQHRVLINVSMHYFELIDEVGVDLLTYFLEMDAYVCITKSCWSVVACCLVYLWNICKVSRSGRTLELLNKNRRIKLIEFVFAGAWKHNNNISQQ